MVKKLKQNIRLLVSLITCFVLFSSVFAQALEVTDKELRFYTEISPPYFWLDENRRSYWQLRNGDRKFNRSDNDSTLTYWFSATKR